jgi:transposase
VLRATGILSGTGSDLRTVRLLAAQVRTARQWHNTAVVLGAGAGHLPARGGLYTFTNRRHNKIKLLFWEDNGFVLSYKSLAEEKFRWPRPQDETMALTGEQINWLLDGYDISLLKGHKKLYYEGSF